MIWIGVWWCSLFGCLDFSVGNLIVVCFRLGFDACFGVNYY